MAPAATYEQRGYYLHIVFIGGPQRSGTTLLQILVANALGNVPILAEAHLICGLIELHQRGIRNWPKTSGFFKDQKDFRNYTRSCIRTILEPISQFYGDSIYIVLKDPNFALWIDSSLELFPNSTFFYCIRDPRDIVCSFLKIEKREKKMQDQREQYRNRNIPFYCSKIKRNFRGLMRSNFEPIICRYEDLVAEPLSELERLSHISDLPLTLQKIDNLKWPDASLRHKASWTSALEEKEPSTESVGNYRKYLSKNEILIVQRKCKSIFDKFGYKKDLSLKKTNYLKELLQRFGMNP